MYITYPNVAYHNSFALTKGNVLDVTAFYIEITEEQAPYLTILNSKIVEELIKNSAIERRGGFREYKTQYMTQLPLPKLTRSQQVGLVSIARDFENIQKNLTDLIYAFKNFSVTDRKIDISINHLELPEWDELKKIMMSRKVKYSIGELEEMFNWYSAKKAKIEEVIKNLDLAKETTSKFVEDLFDINEDEKVLFTVHFNILY